MPVLTLLTSLAATVASTTYAPVDTTVNEPLALAEDEDPVLPVDPVDDRLEEEDEPVDPPLPPLTTSPTATFTASTVPEMVEVRTDWLTASSAFA
jgi:hypothetical protein